MEVLSDKTWKCPKCETINSSESCIVCGEKRAAMTAEKKPVESDARTPERSADIKPKYDKAELKPMERASAAARIVSPAPAAAAPEYYRARRGSKKKRFARKGQIAAIIVLSIIILTMASSPLVLTGLNYRRAEKAAAEENYSEALRYLDGFTTKRGKELKLECTYQSAVQQLNSGEAQKAKAVFLELDGYKDAEEKVKQCEYNSAKWYLSSGMLFEAYDAFGKAGDYSDAGKKLAETKKKLYDKGTELYRSGSLDEAKMYFEKSSDVGREEDYLMLIQAKKGNGDISQLRLLIDFEDTKKILLTDKYAEEFLMGDWKNAQGYYIRFYKQENDNTIWCRYSMPVMPEGERWKIENGRHYCGDDSYGWTEYWEYSIVFENVIDVTVKSNGKTYRFTRM